MAHKKIDMMAEEERIARKELHNANSKGRVKEKMKKVLTREWQDFSEWDDVPIETFEKFSRRGR